MKIYLKAPRILVKRIAIISSFIGLPLALIAQTAIIDIGNGEGTPTSPDTNGNYWNLIDATNSPVTLTSSENSATGWSFQIIGTEHAGHQFTGSLNAASTGAPADFAISGGYQDAWYDNENGSPVSFSFSGLDSSKTYAIEIWGSRLKQGGGNSWSNGEVSVTAGSANEGPDFVLLDGSQGNVLTITATANGSGVFAFDFDRGTGTGVSTGINAMSITVIPEPVTFGLLTGAFCLVALFYSRRRSSSKVVK